jgi:hypothetical protein
MNTYRKRLEAMDPAKRATLRLVAHTLIHIYVYVYEVHMLYIYIYVCVYIYIYMYVCICVDCTHNYASIHIK